MVNYEIIPHLADLKIRVWGETKQGLFSNAVLAMNELLKPALEGRKRGKKKTFKVSSFDTDALLVDFLNEVLCLSQTHRELYDKINFQQFSDTGLTVEISGRKAKRFSEDIKAVTHHNLNTHEREDGAWEAIILLDV